jgi:hypothetical protein
MGRVQTRERNMRMEFPNVVVQPRGNQGAFNAGVQAREFFISGNTGPQDPRFVSRREKPDAFDTKGKRSALHLPQRFPDQVEIIVGNFPDKTERKVDLRVLDPPRALHGAENGGDIVFNAVGNVEGDEEPGHCSGPFRRHGKVNRLQ